MEISNIGGVAVYPAGLRRGQSPIAGVWFAASISPAQHQALLDLNAACAPGHIGVRTSERGTAVSFVGKLPEKLTTYKMAKWLAGEVKRVVGLESMLRQLKNYEQVSRALA